MAIPSRQQFLFQISLLPVTCMTCFSAPLDSLPYGSSSSTIIVLGLRHLSMDMKGFEALNAQSLANVLQKIRPDIVAAEINQEWLDSYQAGKATDQIRGAIEKGEYGQVIFPLAKKNGWRVVGVGVESLQESVKAQKEEELLNASDYGKGLLEGLGRFIKIFYGVLNRDFHTFDGINSAEYDRLMEIKHRYTDSIKYHYWESRNARMVELICRLGRDNSGKRIVVTVGAEHGYALRKGMGTCPGIAQLRLENVLVQ